MAKLRTFRPPKPKVFRSGPWKGCRAVPRGPGVNSEEYLYSTGNAVLDETGGFITRPGAERLNSSALTTPVQLMYAFYKSDGTLLLVTISHGEIYTFSGGTYTKVVSAANLVTDGTTVSNSARMYAVTLAGKMVITDGTNKPFTWDGSSGAGHTVTLTNADVWYGQPTVYYAKVFAIKNTDRLTIEWSEENDPTTGYAAGGFTNTWTLVQTSSIPLVGLLGTNEALYYWRVKGMGAIRGAVNTDFTTTGTLDAISDSLGLCVSGARAEINGAIWWVDQEGKPRKYNGTLDHLWEQISDQYPPFGVGSSGSYAFGTNWTPSYTQINYLPSHGLVILSLAIAGNSNAAEHYVFQDTGNFISDWGITGIAVAATWFSTTANMDYWVGTDTSGYSFQVGLPGVYYDQNNAGSASAITMTLVTHRLGWTGKVEWQFTELDVVFNVTSSPSTLACAPSLDTSRQSGQGLTSKTTDSSSGVGEKHGVWGTNRNGRWIAYTLPVTTSATNSTKPYGVRSLSVTAVPVSATPYLT